MTRNLETADVIVKLTLAIAVLILYFTRLITGPSATGLMILAIVVILIFVARLVFARIFKN
jgi:hypothetical protein